MPLPPYYLKAILTSRMACIVAIMMYRGGILQVLFESFSKDPGGSPMYSSSQVRSPHWNQYMAPLLLTIGSLSLGETSRFLMVLLPLKWVCMPYLPHIFLMHLQRPCVKGMTIWPLVFTSLVVCWAPGVPWLLAPSMTSLGGLLSLFSTLSKAHFGHLHWVGAFLR